ncbi:DUF4402 domain-containing protein [Mucilaginibacter ginkgonis]|uniref:DUF4402 domain-containing protein n=1 Tax=Mucilaginibacter ginkgonis TaxID=2682091 RepID=A0A6I4IP63_9SPHI|nr:DUF4402 domain-containing protein [Mucilaginibacter ginkgonis]QQL49132.1 DUF4402 domain-containing protein [Mucilaginibacter ginkgonis]
MRADPIKIIPTKNVALATITFCMLMLCALISFAQPQKPPRPIKVTIGNAQGLQFGAFSQTGSGGTVQVTSTGSRSSSGSIILLNLGYTYAPAIYNIDSEPGVVVTIVNGSDVTLTGSGGGTMSLHLGSSTPTSPFVVPRTPSPYPVYIGGTLTVNTGSVPGNYTGSFNITFVQQ